MTLIVFFAVAVTVCCVFVDSFFKNKPYKSKFLCDKKLLYALHYEK